MNHLLNPENPLMQFLTRLTDLMLLSILWTACAFPLLTVGPATAALYYVIFKMLRGEESGIVKAFFHSFCQNLLQGIGLTVLLALSALFLYWDLQIFAAQTGAAATVLRTVLAVFAVILVLAAGYVFPLLSQYENTLLHTLRNALLLAMGNPLRSVPVLLLNLIAPAAFLISPAAFLKALPLWLILAPATVAYTAATLLYKPLTGKKLPRGKPDSE